MDQTHSPEMDSLVDQVLRGERMLLFAPGNWPFVGAGGTTGLGITFLVTALLPALIADYSTPARAISEMVGVGLGATTAGVCGRLVINAVAIPKIWASIASIGFTIALVTLAVMLFQGDPLEEVASCIAVVMLGIATGLLRTSSFSLFVLLHQRLKVRRQVLLDQMRSTAR